MGDAIRVGVVGAAGRMGSVVCQAVEQAEDMALAARAATESERERLAEARAQVAVDFTHPSAVMDTLRWCVARGISVVVGTSGFDEARIDEVRAMLAASSQGTPQANVIIAPNFSIGGVLMMRFAEQAARFYDSVEILEQHHPEKIDAPSGTAVRTAERVAVARSTAHVPDAPDATETSLDGARGASVAGIPVHAMRISGLFAHQEVWLGSPGETLTIRHDSHDRSAYMPGVLLAIRHVLRRPGLTVGLDELLEE